MITKILTTLPDWEITGLYRITVVLVARFKTVTLSIHVNQCSSFVPTPVVCDPPCENGACVANDTCNCADGYEGERCTDRSEFATSLISSDIASVRHCIV